MHSCGLLAAGLHRASFTRASARLQEDKLLRALRFIDTIMLRDVGQKVRPGWQACVPSDPACVRACTRVVCVLVLVHSCVRLGKPAASSTLLNALLCAPGLNAIAGKAFCQAPRPSHHRALQALFVKDLATFWRRFEGRILLHRVLPALIQVRRYTAAQLRTSSCCTAAVLTCACGTMPTACCRSCARRRCSPRCCLWCWKCSRAAARRISTAICSSSLRRCSLPPKVSRPCHAIGALPLAAGAAVADRLPPHVLLAGDFLAALVSKSGVLAGLMSE